MPMFTNRRTLAGEGFWGGWREAVVTDVMPRSYATVSPVESGEEERVWTKSIVSDIPQTQDVVEQATVKTPAKTVGGVVPKQTGAAGGVEGGGMMTTTAMPGTGTTTSAGADATAGPGEAELEPNEADADVHTTTKIETQDVTETTILTETAVITETIVVTELAIGSDADVIDGERRRFVKEDL